MWPPSSPNLNTKDFEICSILKSKACRRAYTSIAALQRDFEVPWRDIDANYVRLISPSGLSLFWCMIKPCGGHL